MMDGERSVPRRRASGWTWFAFVLSLAALGASLRPLIVGKLLANAPPAAQPRVGDVWVSIGGAPVRVTRVTPHLVGYQYWSPLYEKFYETEAFNERDDFVRYSMSQGPIEWPLPAQEPTESAPPANTDVVL